MQITMNHTSSMTSCLVRLFLWLCSQCTVWSWNQGRVTKPDKNICTVKIYLLAYLPSHFWWTSVWVQLQWTNMLNKSEEKEIKQNQSVYLLYLWSLAHGCFPQNWTEICFLDVLSVNKGKHKSITSAWVEETNHNALLCDFPIFIFI